MKVGDPELARAKYVPATLALTRTTLPTLARAACALTPPLHHAADAADAAPPATPIAAMSAANFRTIVPFIQTPSVVLPSTHDPITVRSSRQMQLLFVDESGRLDEDGLFALGGIAVA